MHADGRRFDQSDAGTAGSGLRVDTAIFSKGEQWSGGEVTTLRPIKPVYEMVS